MQQCPQRPPSWTTVRPQSTVASMDWRQHRLLRPVVCVVLVVALMKSLHAHWSRLTDVNKGTVQVPLGGVLDPEATDRLVVAHFMLGNTYPFTQEHWLRTFDLAVETGLDALALNLGSESWQADQATSAYTVLSRSRHVHKLKLFISLDMNALPSASAADAAHLARLLARWLASDAQLVWRRAAVLGTFGGHDASFGGQGWPAVLDPVRKLGNNIVFFPAFFLPPERYLALEHVDGVFAWNSAWPMGNSPINLDPDQPFLQSPKPYMAAVSPNFFTHYGKTGDWAWNKNWIYRSDDLLYPTRWLALLHATATGNGPDMIQIISWNDYGESHNIAPVLGAQPGSEAWTDGMDHEAFRRLTREFATRWKYGQSCHVQQPIVFIWYRPHPAALIATNDQVGRPDHADWARDLINIVVLAPSSSPTLSLILHNGNNTHQSKISPGNFNMFTHPFVPGQVTFELMHGPLVLLSGRGLDIAPEIERYNFNFWSSVWPPSA